MTVDDEEKDVEPAVLDTIEGEIAFFRSLMRARPVGIHRHFHVLAMRNAIQSETGQLVPVDDIWQKLRACYDLDALEGLETDGYDSPGSDQSVESIPSPSPSENLSGHPHFRHEFSLPADEAIESLVTSRRLRGSASLPSSSPAESPSAYAAAKTKTKGEARRRGKKRERRDKSSNMAGLVAGDSDSSALTQDSGQNSLAQTPRDSVVTGTDGDEEGGVPEDEAEEEPREASPEPSASKATRNRANSKSTKKAGSSTIKTRTTAAASASRPAKRRKR